MKTIKIIDLLNIISKGEEVPKKIRYINLIWEYDDEIKDYIHDDLFLFYDMNGIGISENYVEILEEPKKIPEKLNIRYKDNDIIINEKILQEDLNTELADKINEILDYLESKGDE